MSDPKNPLPGELSIDASDLAPFIVDLPPGGMRGLRPEQDNLNEVRKEIVANQPKYGDTAGITNSVFTQFQTVDQQIEQIDKFLQPAEKLVEVLIESRARLVDQRERLVAGMAESAERQAKTSGNDELLARYATTREYRSQTAMKAAKTRKKNEEAAKQGEEAKPEQAKPEQAPMKPEPTKPEPTPV